MHPIFIIIFIACAAWFFSVAAMARKGIGARIGLAIMGVVEFVIVTAVLERMVKNQEFFREALRSGPDIGPIMIYIVLPSVVVVFLSGLLLKRVLSCPDESRAEQ